MECLCSLLLALVHSPFSNCRRLPEKQLGRLVYPNFVWAKDSGRFILEVRSNSNPDRKSIVVFRPDDKHTGFLNEKIKQNDVKFVQYVSYHEICFQSLVIDTTIIIDQPTFLNESCDDDDTRLCKAGMGD